MNNFRIRFGCVAGNALATREVRANDAVSALAFVISNAPILERYPWWEVTSI